MKTALTEVERWTFAATKLVSLVSVWATFVYTVWVIQKVWGWHLTSFGPTPDLTPLAVAFWVLHVIFVSWSLPSNLIAIETNKKLCYTVDGVFKESEYTSTHLGNEVATSFVTAVLMSVTLFFAWLLT